MDLRSSISGRVQLRRKAASPMGTPMRKMVWMVWAIPLITAACTAAGRWWMAAGLSALRLNPGGALVRCSAARTLDTTRLA